MKSRITRFDKEGIKGLFNRSRDNFRPVPDEVANKIIEL
jgi:hypothetical protein